MPTFIVTPPRASTDTTTFQTRAVAYALSHFPSVVVGEHRLHSLATNSSTSSALRHSRVPAAPRFGVGLITASSATHKGEGR